MEDMAPALLERLQALFENNMSTSRAGALLEKIAAGKAGYADAGDYAEEVGRALADAFAFITGADLPDGRMYWNIADRVVRPLLEEDHALVSAAAVQVQQTLNAAAGLGLKAQAAPMDEDRVAGLLNKLAAAVRYDDVADLLNEPVITFSRAVVDETVRRNIEFQGKAGLNPKIIRRTSGKCCEWCSRMAGSYSYPNVPRDVYRRHARCRCSLEYDPGSGRRKVLWTENDAAQQRRQTEFDREKQMNEQERFRRFTEQYRAASEEELLPGHENAVIPAEKLAGYALNMDHPTGRAKAIAFRDALGYTVNNERELEAAIRQGLLLWKATPRPETQYGRRYEVRMLFSGPNGKQATVKTGWQVSKDHGVPRLVTIYVYEEKGR